jgi:hypothetical protein
MRTMANLSPKQEIKAREKQVTVSQQPPTYNVNSTVHVINTHKSHTDRPK